MKRLIIIFPILCLTIICVLQACKKKDDYPSTLVTISYPVVTLNGAPDTTINRGATWNDPGATWVDSVTGERGSISVTVNTSVDSAYLLVYTAKNKNGFQTAVYRGLGVTNQGNAVDISGVYADSYGGTDTIVKVSRALFYSPSVDAQGNQGLIVIKSDSTISVSTIVQASLTGAIIPETFGQASISYQLPVTLTYTPSVLNVPPGSYSGYGLPIGIQISFSRQQFGPFLDYPVVITAP